MTRCLPYVNRLYRTIDSFDDTDMRQYFRIKTKDQLDRQVTGFRIPEELRSGVGNKFSGEEILLLCQFSRGCWFASNLRYGKFCCNDGLHNFL